MARFKITTKCVTNCNGIHIEPGMSVEVVTQNMCNPVTTNGGKSVIDAFYRTYGIDIEKAGCLNMVELDVKQLPASKNTSRATKDEIGPNKLHHIPLMKEIYKYNRENVQDIFIDTDHSYSDKRVLLSKVVAEYIENIYNEL